MKMHKVVYETTQAWEEWTVEVPDDATEAEARRLIATGEAEFLCMEESGNNGMTAVAIDDVEICPCGCGNPMRKNAYPCGKCGYSKFAHPDTACERYIPSHHQPICVGDTSA